MRQYETYELSYTAAAPAGDEVAVNLSAEFTKGKKRVSVKGFYAGNGEYKLRFLPEEPGEWKIKVRGIVSRELTVTAAPAAVGRHGIPRASGTHLVFSDGTRFDSFGTTVYALAHQTKELMEETFASLAEAPFNKVRMCVFPKHYQYNHNDPEHYAFRTLPGKTLETVKRRSKQPYAQPAEKLWDVKHPDFRFWEDFEATLRRLDSMGIVVDLILFHPYDRWGLSTMERSEDLTYLDYLLRRLSAFPNLMWSMANEYDLFPDKRSGDWHAVEQFIAANDPMGHMLSNHNCFAPYDYSRRNITHVSIQCRAVCRVPALLQKYRKPVLFDECAYEGNLEETFGSISGQEMSDRFWKVFVTGGYCTHGETFIDYSAENADEAVVFWAKGGKLQGESPARIAYLRHFAESLPGAVDPLAEGLSGALAMPRGLMRLAGAAAPEAYRPFVRAMAAMSREETFYHTIPEMSYAGHVGDAVYLWYYGSDRHSGVTLKLPKGKKYTVKAIDTWNMTETVIARGVTSGTRVLTPDIQWLAVAAYLE